MGTYAMLTRLNTKNAWPQEERTHTQANGRDPDRHFEQTESPWLLQALSLR